MTENCKLRKAIYIIRILQHFATKLWNITNFVMLFQAVSVMKFLSRLVEFKILVNWGMVHSLKRNRRSFNFVIHNLYAELHTLTYL